MAFSGVHIVCGYAGSDDYEDRDVPILGEAIWSESFATASPGTTAKAAPEATLTRAQAIFSIDTSVDIFFAVGKTPNASASPRRLLKAGEKMDVFVKLGDKLAWIAA